MIALTYKERFKRILQKDEISEEDVRLFDEAIKQFTSISPDWKKNSSQTTLIREKKDPIFAGSNY